MPARLSAGNTIYQSFIRFCRKWEGNDIVVCVVSWGGVTLNPLGISTIIWRIVSVRDDGLWWVWNSLLNYNWKGKHQYSEKTCPRATLFTTNSIWPDLDSNRARGGRKPTTNRLSYGTANTYVDLKRVERESVFVCVCLLVFVFVRERYRENVDWIHLAQDRYHWWGLVSVILDSQLAIALLTVAMKLHLCVNIPTSKAFLPS
jgi:hypothetical protein